MVYWNNVTVLALGLILSSAVAHATWNLLAKRASGAGVLFLWMFSAASTLIYAPLAMVVFLVRRPELGAVELLFMFGSGTIAAGYFLVLQRGYRSGDLSFVYPLARGTGPVLATAAALVAFGERPTPTALLGVALVAVGVFVLTARPGEAAARATVGPNAKALGSGAIYGVAAGIFVAAAITWDKHAVAGLLIPPLLLTWSGSLTRTLLFAPLALPHWREVRKVWQDNRLEVLGVGVLDSLSYLLVLSALVFAPVGYVAPAREVSVLVGVLLGARVLAEGEALRRLPAASSIVLGVVALTIAW